MATGGGLGRRRRIVFVGFEGATALDLVGPLQVFDTAGRVAAGSPHRSGAYECLVASPGGQDFRCDGGPTMVADRDLSRVRSAHTMVVAGGFAARTPDPALVAGVRRLAPRCRRVASVCTGAFVLAAAGLLEGREALTHWAFMDALPGAAEGDHLYREDDGIWTSAGVTAGMDLALALVEGDLGREVALETARWLVLYVHRPGHQAQFSAQLAGQLAERDALRELQSWILEHPAQDLRVPALAARIALSPRQFQRVFRDETGTTPARFVEAARVEVARRLLGVSGMDLDAVADASGLGSARNLRRVFVKRLGISPRAYRQRFVSPASPSPPRSAFP
ncbi:MAG: helix-turn-helix domain-containing protein [Myxococcota bacterium]